MTDQNLNQPFENSVSRGTLDTSSKPLKSGNLISGGNQISSKSRWPIIALVLVLALGLGGWLVWRYLPTSSVPTLTEDMPPAVVEDEPVFLCEGVRCESKTTIYFGVLDDRIYLKKESFMNGRPLDFCEAHCYGTYVYIENTDGIPKELPLDNIPTNLVWQSLVTQPLRSLIPEQVSRNDEVNLFSFKQRPNTEQFLFVLDSPRIINGPDIVSNERTLYWYDPVKGLKEVLVFNHSQGFSYPIIQSFNSDGKLVSLGIYGCWNCDGHIPETWLIDLESLVRTGGYLSKKNIGRVLDFGWTSSNSFRYKEYIEEEVCQAEVGPCIKNPDSLPFITDNFY